MDRREERWYLIANEIAGARGHISGRKIAAMLGVTARTVRKELQVLTGYLEAQGIQIESKPGKGYCMTSGREIWSLRGGELFHRQELSESDRRQHYLMQRLLHAHSHVKIADLSDELFVSATVISAELKRVRESLSYYEIQLEILPSHGIRTRGREQYLRSGIIGEYPFYQSMRGTPYAYPPFGRLFETRDETALAQIEETLRQTLTNPDKKPYFLSERAMKDIAVAVLLSINADKRPAPMAFTAQEIYETQLTRTYQTGREILALLSERLHVLFSEEEQIYFGNFILGYRTFLRFEEVSVKQNYYRAVDCVNESIVRLVAQCGVKQYVYDRVVKERLGLFLLSLSARINIRMIAEEPLTGVACRRSLIARELAVVVARYLEGYYHQRIHHSEVERLSLIFLPTIQRIGLGDTGRQSVAVISQRYPRDIAQMAVEWEFSKYRRAEEVQVLSFEAHQVREVIAADQFQLLVTDLPEDAYAGFRGDVLRSRFDFSDSDSQRIWNWMERKDADWAKIEAMLSPDPTFCDCAAETRTAAIALMGSRLEEAGLTDESIYADLTQRDLYSSFAVGNGLGFFKTLYTYGDRSFFRIFRFKKPLPWHGEKVQLIFALSTGRESPEDLLLFKGWMDRLLSDRNQARAVLEADCRTVADVLKTLFYSS